MASLQIRDIPLNIEKKLKNEAKKYHRSLTQQAIATLEKGLGFTEPSKEKRKKTIQNLLDNPIVEDTSKLKDHIPLIREDRNR